MERYQVILAYDGARFCGFQRQAGDADGGESSTVQAVVEAALRQIGWQGKSVLAAGRTDRGVHAAGQVIAFDLAWRHSLQDLLRALNAHLPAQVAARSVKVVSRDFHPRYAAIARHYRYRLFCDEVRDPLRERYAWRVWPAVSLAPMQLAVSGLIGSHDFAAFGRPPRPGGSTVRSVTRADWREVGGDLVFELIANAFLYHMVRRLVFLCVDIGQGKENPEVISRHLEGLEASPPKGLAPPQGLTLVEVFFPPSADAESA